MKRFIIRVTYFLLPIVILAYPIDLFLSKNLYRTGSEFGDVPEVKAIQEGSIDADILIIGSSRAEVHFDTRIFTKEFGKTVFNLGQSGANWHLIQHRLEAYQEHNKMPEYLIVNIDVGTFMLYAGKPKVRPHILPYMLHNKHIYKYYDVSPEDFLLPLVRYIGFRKVLSDAIILWWEDKIIESDKHNGFLPVDKPFDDSPLEEFKSKDFSRLDIPPLELYQYLETYFPDTKIVGVHSPIFLDSLKRMNLNHIRADQFQSEFEKRNWIFLDYSFSQISQDRKNFYNSTHMNAHGAAVFTKELISDLRKTGLFLREGEKAEIEQISK